MPHTPEPWTSEGPEDREGYRVGVYANGEETIICEVTIEDVTDEEFAANLALIKAAPKLLAACKAAKAFGSQGDLEDGTSVSWLIESAIAAAEPQP